MAGLIIDRGRGPELKGTRVTVYCVMDYVRAGDLPSQIAEDLELSMEQVQAALEYISAHRDEVEAQYEAILKRVSQPNPDWVEAGSAHTWDEPVLNRGTIPRRAGACSSRAITTWVVPCRSSAPSRMAIVLTFAPRPRLIQSSDRLLFDQVITMATVTIEVPDERLLYPSPSSANSRLMGPTIPR